jgi:hypothetical protein
MTTITLNWETKNGQYKQDFNGLNTAIKEMNKMAEGSNKTSIVIFDRNSNWDLVIRSNEEVYYMAKEGSKCSSGYYGTIGHLRNNIRLGYEKTKLN